MDPAATLGALDHARVEVVVVVAGLAQGAEAALFLLDAAEGAERLLGLGVGVHLGEVGHVGLAARGATEARLAALKILLPR